MALNLANVIRPAKAHCVWSPPCPGPQDTHQLDTQPPPRVLALHAPLGPSRGAGKRGARCTCGQYPHPTRLANCSRAVGGDEKTSAFLSWIQTAVSLRDWRGGQSVLVGGDSRSDGWFGKWIRSGGWGRGSDSGSAGPGPFPGKTVTTIVFTFSISTVWNATQVHVLCIAGW